MFLWRHVAEHRGAEPADHRRADAACDVVIAGSDVSGKRPERVERSFAANLELLVHILFDKMHRHVARAFDHGLAVHFPSDLGQLTESV